MKPRTRVIEETYDGVYVWEMPDGRWVGDDEGHYMLIASKKGDLTRVNMLADAARAHGVYEGRAVFLSGKRPVSDEDYEEQRQRLLFGLTPDPLDVYAHRDEAKYGTSHD